jgi:hypothetical protein
MLSEIEKSCCQGRSLKIKTNKCAFPGIFAEAKIVILINF